MSELRGEERSWLERAWRFQRDGWIFVHVEGEAFARGFAHGFLLAQEIDAGIRDNNFQNDWSTGNWWPIVKGKPLGELRSGEHCNSFIATGDGVTADGGIVLAHNTWDTYIDANSSNVVLDLVPDRGARILMQTRPGYIHSGTDFFLCGSGIIGAETTIAGFTEYDQKKTPELVRIRQAMQYADSLDSFIEIMWRDNNGGYANSWMLGDLKTGEIAKFEIGLKYYGLQRTKRGSYWGCNVVEDKRIRYQECDGVGYSNLLKKRRSSRSLAALSHRDAGSRRREGQGNPGRSLR
jgi:hypothetical protein